MKVDPNLRPMPADALASSSPADSAAPAHRLQLGDLTLDVDHGELWSRDGSLAPLRPRSLRLLLELARHAGHVVGKDELLEAVWPGLVVVEGSVAQAIADIRRLLGPRAHEIVRTVARRGYLLVPDAGEGQRPVQAFADVPQALPWLSIAVLPLQVQSPDAPLGALASALHHDLVTALAHLPGARLVARDAVAAVAPDGFVDPRRIGAAFGVRHVVRGAVRLEGGLMRWNVSLADGRTGEEHWAEVFRIPMAEAADRLGAFVVQVERALQAGLYRACAADASRAAPQDADGLAVQAFALWFSGFTRPNVERGMRLLSQAVALDPDVPRAWAGLCFMTFSAYCQGWDVDADTAFTRVEQAVHHLERLDRDGNYTDQAKAVLLGLRRDLPTLLAHAREWVLRHGHPTAHGTLGAALLGSGEFEAAQAALLQALHLSPRDPYRSEWQHRLAMCHFALADFEQAAHWSRLALQTNTAVARAPLHAAALAQVGQERAARQALQEHERQHGPFDEELLLRGWPGDDARWVAAREAVLQALKRLRQT
jgi:DNA-binding winged helix-turn-helix (wHTH) protein/tetratricopeptide (TPR) repeat protein